MILSVLDDAQAGKHADAVVVLVITSPPTVVSSSYGGCDRKMVRQSRIIIDIFAIDQKLIQKDEAAMQRIFIAASLPYILSHPSLTPPAL